MVYVKRRFYVKRMVYAKRRRVAGIGKVILKFSSETRKRNTNLKR